MASIGVRVLRSVLNHLGIPRHDWSLLTSGLSDSLGHQMLAFNHFRADKLVRGSKFHRDSGWVTVLRSTEPGLLAYIDGELCAINPVPNHLIINFGSSIEVLTECMKPKVRANIHGVVQTERQGIDDRVSYAMFLDSNLDGGIYRYGPSGPIWLQSVSDFAIQEVGRTYDANDGTL
jgi:isopenicillin N synthase-like dioxygenase